MSEEQKNAVNSSKFTVKTVLRVLALLAIIFVFCPSFLVSCSGQTKEISVMTAVGGLQTGSGEKVVDAHPIMLICLLIPAAILVLLFVNKLTEKKLSMTIAGTTVVDLIVWIIFRSKVKEVCESYYCGFETTAWYYINVIALIFMIVLSGAVFLNKMQLETNLIDAFSGARNTVDNGEQTGVVTSGDSQAPSAVDAKAIVAKGKALPKNAKIGGILGCVVLLIVIIFAYKSSRTIDLDKYTTIETSGYNGYGHAEVVIDWKAIGEKYGSKLEISKKAPAEYKTMSNLSSPLAVLMDVVNTDLDKSEKLYNNDEVAYTWDIDEKVEKAFNCKIKYKNGKHKVSGLEELKTFDAFSKLKISYESAAPYATLNLEYDGNELDESDFICDKREGLKNGDTITISINEDHIESIIEDTQMIPAESEKKIKVKGVDEYITKFKDISDDFLSTLKSETEDEVVSYVASSYSDNITVTDTKYAGYILNTLKKDASGKYNQLYIIYSSTVSHNEGKFATTTIYYPVLFTDVVKTKDGMSYGQKDGIHGHTSIGGDFWYSTSGYENPLDCYIELGADKGNSYKTTAGGDFEKYAKFKIIRSTKDITEEFNTAAQEHVRGVVQKYVDSYNAAIASDLQYAGSYFLYSKDENNSDIEQANSYIVVFSATVSPDSRHSFNTQTVYFPVIFDGLVKLDNGEVIAIKKSGQIEGSYNRFSDDRTYTSGYTDGKDMFNELVTEKRNNYKYEVSSELQQFGK